MLCPTTKCLSLKDWSNIEDTPVHLLQPWGSHPCPASCMLCSVLLSSSNWSTLESAVIYTCPGSVCHNLWESEHLWVWGTCAPCTCWSHNRQHKTPGTYSWTLAARDGDGCVRSCAGCPLKPWGELGALSSVFPLCGFASSPSWEVVCSSSSCDLLLVTWGMG